MAENIIQRESKETRTEPNPRLERAFDTDEERRIREEVIRVVREELPRFIVGGNFLFERNIKMSDGKNIQLAVGTGTKIGTAATQKLGFFGETPVVQQTTSSQSPATFSAGTSGIVNDSATWGGYTIGDIVAILQAFGLIA